MAETNGLLNRRTLTGYRGFESPLLRNKKSFGFFILKFYYAKLHVIMGFWGFEPYPNPMDFGKRKGKKY